MVTLLKLGGSLITDKTKRATLRPDVLERITKEIRAALDSTPNLRLIIGHGSGSFGHFEAQKYNTIRGVESVEGWRGFARVGRVASELNFYVAEAFAAAGVDILRVQPSASAIANNGVIQQMAIQPIMRAVDAGLIPLVHGDVAFDDTLGGTIISTETVFQYLVYKLPVKRILLVGEVDGVLDVDGQVIPQITRENYATIAPALGGSEGVDVTGGMAQKVQDMLTLASEAPYPIIHILNGMVAGRVTDALAGRDVNGTQISQ